MYEDTEQPVLRRILWIVLWFIIVATIAWALIWLVFFRHHNVPNNSGSITHTPNHSQSSSTGTKVQSPSTHSGSSSTATNGGSSAMPPSTSSTPAGSSSTTQAPSTLANTGAGDIFTPFIVASLAGSVVYYVRLHKKLTR
jgi:cytoskeletal protein RodZ